MLAAILSNTVTQKQFACEPEERLTTATFYSAICTVLYTRIMIRGSMSSATGVCGDNVPHFWGQEDIGGTMKMISSCTVSNLCFYSEQSFEVFLLCSVQVTEVQLP